MTVAELIAHLKNYPPDSVVLVDGYEEDLDMPTTKEIYTLKVKEKDFSDKWSGKYWESDKLDRDNPNPEFLATIISRPSK